MWRGCACFCRCCPCVILNKRGMDDQIDRLIEIKYYMGFEKNSGSKCCFFFFFFVRGIDNVKVLLMQYILISR